MGWLVRREALLIFGRGLERIEDGGYDSEAVREATRLRSGNSERS